MPAPARLPVQLSTEAGYVEGDTAERQRTDEQLSEPGLPLGLEAPVMTPNGVNFLSFFQLSDAYQDGDIALHELIAARKISYLPVVEQQLADLEDDTSDFTTSSSNQKVLSSEAGRTN